MRVFFLALLAVLSALAASCGNLDNPPVTREPAWDSERTRALAVRACFECHSNETHWEWYAYLPVVSANLASGVFEARSKLNFSEWDRPQKEHDDAAEKVVDREMPPGDFLFAHPDADLSDAERRELADGFARTFAADPPPDGDDEDNDDEDNDDD